MKRTAACVVFAALATAARAQLNDQPNSTAMNDAEMALMDQASGTSRNPAAAPMPMIMKAAGAWHFMFMATAFLTDLQQSGPRGHDKFYSVNWGMVSAEHHLGRGAISVDVMLSLEPLTVTDRRYPELFQTGETAYGVPLVDAQHPHNLIMAAGIHYLRPISEYTTLHLYLAPVGDPALGPVAFPHRASAAELPQAPLSHHWQDSTHVAYEVVTAGISQHWFKVEASGFHGREPNENRWNINTGAIDSWSGRLSFAPSANWSAQVSAGRVAHPEALEPGDVVRATASVSYDKTMRRGHWDSTLIWGRNHNTATHADGNSYLAETVFPATRANLLTARAELVDKDELFPGSNISYRIGAITAGYTHDIATPGPFETGIGANVTTYRVPSAIQPAYGVHPVAVNVYVRVRLRPH